MPLNPRDHSLARQMQSARGHRSLAAGDPIEGRYGYAAAFGWAAGFALVVIGIMFLLQNAGEPEGIRNTWAMALAIPVAITAATAWVLYRRAGKTLTRAAAGALTASFVLVAVGVILALGLAWEHTWPLLMITAGMSLLAQAMVPGHDAAP